MFESNMDEYLEEEIDHLKLTLENICAEWDRNVRIALQHRFGSISATHKRFRRLGPQPKRSSSHRLIQRK